MRVSKSTKKACMTTPYKCREKVWDVIKRSLIIDLIWFIKKKKCDIWVQFERQFDAILLPDRSEHSGQPSQAESTQ